MTPIDEAAFRRHVLATVTSAELEEIADHLVSRRSGEHCQVCRDYRDEVAAETLFDHDEKCWQKASGTASPFCWVHDQKHHREEHDHRRPETRSRCCRCRWQCLSEDGDGRVCDLYHNHNGPHAAQLDDASVFGRVQWYGGLDGEEAVYRPSSTPRDERAHRAKCEALR